MQKQHANTCQGRVSSSRVCIQLDFSAITRDNDIFLLRMVAMIIPCLE